MLIYYLLAAGVLVLAVPLCMHRPTHTKKAVYLLAVFGVLFLLSVLREGIGFDYYRYEEMFALARMPWQSAEVTVDIGFELLLRLFALLHLPDAAIFAVLAFGCLAPVAWFIYRYSPCVWLSCWLYLTLTFFYGTMNFIRQNLALGVLLLAFPLLLKGTWKAHSVYLAVVALAFFIHTSVIILVPVVLLLHIPLNKWTVSALAVLDVACVVYAQPLLNFFALRADGEYYFLNYHVETIYLVGLRGLFLILPTAFALVLLACRKPLRAVCAHADFYIKMALISACIWSFVIRFFVLERFSLFTYIYIIIALPLAYTALCRPLPQGPEAPAVSARRGWLCRCGVCVLLCATFAYNVFGMYDGTQGFHGVFPYKSCVQILNNLP